MSRYISKRKLICKFLKSLICLSIFSFRYWSALNFEPRLVLIIYYYIYYITIGDRIYMHITIIVFLYSNTVIVLAEQNCYCPCRTILILFLINNIVIFIAQQYCYCSWSIILILLLYKNIVLAYQYCYCSWVTILFSPRNIIFLAQQCCFYETILLLYNNIVLE